MHCASLGRVLFFRVVVLRESHCRQPHCLSRHRLPPQYGGQLAGGKPLDDKFGLMARRVAEVYFNSTAAFYSCALQRINGPSCLPLMTTSIPAPSFKPSFKVAALAAKGLARARALAGKEKLMGGGLGKAAALPPRQGRRSLQQAPGHSPYWATPQCVLTRHMLARLPDLEVVACTAESMPIRLARPTR